MGTERINGELIIRSECKLVRPKKQNRRQKNERRTALNA